ncbi:hypothetical protein ACMFMG_002895 [Clarireedia jacksonii]
MTTLFCCSSPEPFRPQYLEHEAKFKAFKSWADYPRSSSIMTPVDVSANISTSTSTSTSIDTTTDSNAAISNPITPSTPYAVQFVRQVNYGPLESKRYFIPSPTSPTDFIEITERDLIAANYQKLNSYKNYRCSTHDKFFEVNLYQKDPVNRHHWRANIARPAGDIDLSSVGMGLEKDQGKSEF